MFLLKPVEPANFRHQILLQRMIAALYNAQRTSQLRPPGSECSPKPWKWLVACAKAARSYLYPTLSSINAPKPGQESEEWLDNCHNFRGNHYTNLIISEEEQTRQSQQAQINDVLVAALAKLDGKHNKYYTCTTKRV